MKNFSTRHDAHDDNCGHRIMQVSSKSHIILLCLTIFLFGGSLPSSEGFGIPGTTQTKNGYDREKGTDAICWRSQSASEGLPFNNPLIEDFVVSFDGVKIQSECPMGNNISGVQPSEHVIDGEILRTHREYNYTIFLDINMTSLGANSGFTSDRGPGFIVLQVFSCVAGSAGFCSPFVHEQAIARFREAAAKARAEQANNPSSSGGGSSSSWGSGGNSSSSGRRSGGWVYVRGSIHGGTHVHSGWNYIQLPLEEGPIFKDVRIDISQIALVPGDYVSIAAAQLYFWEKSEGEDEPHITRIDIANILHGRQSLVHYQLPPDILEVPNEVAYFSYCSIGVTSMAMFFLLFQTIRHRNHQIMRLSQGPFLMVFLAAGLTANVGLILEQPRNDFYCRTGNFVLLTSLQIFYAITTGRLWRIHALISPLLLKTLAQPESRRTAICKFLKRITGICFNRRETRKLRTQVTEFQLAILVIVLVAPQIIIQLLGLLIQPRSRIIDFNENESKGRATCDSEGSQDIANTIMYYGYAVFCFLIIGLLVMALQSRKLPSLFNESKNIFESTLTSLVIMIMGVAVILVTQDPTTSPAVSYLIWVATVMTMTVNTSFRIMWPKLSMIWRGETIIVSQLVLDHAKETRESRNRASSTDSSIGGRGSRALVYDNSSFGASATGSCNGRNTIQNISSSTDARDDDLKSTELVPSEVETDELKDDSFPEETVEDLPAPDPQEEEFSEEHPQISCSWDKNVLIKASERFEQADSEACRHSILKKRHKKAPPKKRKLLIEPDQAPSRWLLLRMVDTQEHLYRVTQRLMSGMVVSEADWEHTRSVTRKIGETFSNDVTFTWETKIEEEAEEDVSSRKVGT